MYTKLYDLHFEVGSEQHNYYARNVLGNNAIEFKQFSANMADALSMCVSDMSANGAFQSLNRDPSLSVYPITPHQHNYMITSQGYGGGHNHHHTPATPAIQPFFDLHFECAIESTTGEHHAKCILLNQPPSGILVYHSSSKFLDDAICDVICDLDGDAMFNDLMITPLMSQYPIPGTGNGSGVPTPASVVSDQGVAKKKEVERRLPNDIGRDAIYPACQEICISYDHFRDQKCKSICEWRF